MTTDFISIYLKLSGDAISPQNVRIATLYGVLGGLERAIESMSASMGVKFEANEAIIIPGTLEKSSLGIAGTLNAKAKDPIQHIDRAFYTDEVDMLPFEVRNEFLGIQKSLSARGVRFEMSSAEFGVKNISLSKDAPQIDMTRPDNDEMSAHAVIYGVCMRVNRILNNARIQLRDGSGCTLRFQNDAQIRYIMKATGEDLEQIFRVEGQAIFSLSDYQIRQIDVSSIQTVEHNVKQLFSGLRESTGGSFDGVDAIDYVNELRGK